MTKQQPSLAGIATPDGPLTTPPWSLLGSEPVRAALEYVSYQVMAPREAPSGDGHPVVIFPGLGSDHRSVAPLRSLCTRQGYDTHDWGRGFNTGPHGDAAAWLEALADDVRRMVAKNGQRMSLIGWSLGGIYAREIAKILGSDVRQVITLGSPFSGDPGHTNVAWVYRLLNRKRALVDGQFQSRLAGAPDVPTTSIYTRNDGIVAWQACVQREAAGLAENVEVKGSHCGLCWNRDVHTIVADRLAQEEGAWRPYRVADEVVEKVAATA